MKTFKQFNEGLKTAIGIGAALATPYLLKKFGKPKVDKMIDKSKIELPIGSENRKKKIEKAAGVEGFFDN